MWTTTLESTHPKASMLDAAIDVLIEPRQTGAANLGAILITVPPGATLPTHEHGDSDAVLVPISGELVIITVSDDGEQREPLTPGKVSVIAAHERVKAENTGGEPAKVVACFAPPTFVEALAGG